MFFFFKQKTAYEMRISDWSSDVCSSDLHRTASPGTVHRRIACFLRHGRASPVTDAYRPGGRSGAPAAPCGSPGMGVGFNGVRRTMAGWSRHRGGRPVPEAPPVIGDGRGSTMLLLWISAHPQPTPALLAVPKSTHLDSRH